MLVGYHRRTGHEVTVVFDAWREGGERETSLKTGGVTVVYSRLGETADSVIKRIVSRQDRKWVVVTSDRDVASAAWAASSVAIRSEVFWRFLAQGADEDSMEEEGEDEALRGRGHGRISRREREVRRVLRRL